MPATATSACPACDATLAADGACVACALEQALVGGPAEFDTLHASRAPSNGSAVDFATFAPFTLPCRFDGYQLKRELAAGGMGVVYEAEQASSKRVVALKMVRAFFFAHAEDIARFRTETEAAARLDHAHIVPIYEIGESSGQPFFTMRLMPGGTLSERLAKRRGEPLPPREAVRIIAPVARAVHHAHQRGVLHRDLKPGNILFDEADEPALTDFGLAKLLHADNSLTLSQSLLGTPQYMSPEQAAGRARDLTTASDVWSLGAILYQLITGKLPFEAEGTPETLRRIAEEEPSPPSGVSRAVDKDLETLCLRCLEKDPARRLASAGDLADELDRWSRGEPICSRRVTSAERVVRWLRRRPQIAALLALVLLLFSVAATGIPLQWRRAVAARDEALRRERETRLEAYFASVANALEACRAGDFGRARRLLASLVPRQGQEDLRGFEWQLLHAMCAGDSLASSRFTAAPQTLAWDSGRKKIAVVDASRRLHFVDPPDGKIEAGSVLPDPRADHKEALDHGFHSLSFSPDGRYFTCSDGDVLLVCEAGAARLVHSAAARHIGSIWLDENRLLYGGNVAWAASPRAEPTCVFDVRDGARHVLPRGIFAPFALSSDRRFFAATIVTNADEARVEVRSTLEPNGAVEATFAMEADREPAFLAFSSDASHLAVASGDGESLAREVTVFARDRAEPIFQRKLPRVIAAIAFDSASPTLVVASEDTAIRTFNFLGRKDDEAAAAFLFGHEERVGDLLFLPGDATRLASVSNDGTLRQWSVRERESSKSLRGFLTKYPWRHPAASADGRRVLFVNAQDRAASWEPTSGQTLVFPAGHHPVGALRDGRVLTRLGATGEVALWQCESQGSPPRELWRAPGIASYRDYTQMVRGVLSRDERLAVGLIPGKLFVADLETRAVTGTPDQRMLFGASSVNCLDLSPDGRLAAVTGFLGRRVRLYDTANVNGGFVSLGNADDYDTATAFHPDGRRLYVGNEDGVVRVFDVKTRQELTAEKWHAHAGGVTAIAVSRSGKVIATSGDSSLRLWDADADAAGKAERRERLRIPVETARNWMQFADGDTALLHSAPEHTLEVWEAKAP